MIVVCEGCERRFQLDDSRIPKTGARVRCKHCHHRFRVTPPGDAPTEAKDPSAATPGAPGARPEAKGTSQPGAGGDGLGATAPGQISAEDTLFGARVGEGTGAPIDGDRSLFGSLEDEPAAPGPAMPSDAANEASSGGLTQDLQFVTEPASDDAADAEEAEACAADESLSLPPDESLSAPPDESLSAPPDESLSAPPDESLSASPDDASQPPPDDALSVATDEALSVPPPDASASPEPGASESPIAEPAAAAADGSAPGDAPSAEDSGGEDSWEFADSDLSLTQTPDEDVSEDPVAAAAPPPEPAAAEEPGEAPPPDAGESRPLDAGEAMQLDPGASHPDAAPAPGLVDETPSLRAVGPGAGPDTAVFEMVAGEDDGLALELAGDAPEAAAPGGRPPDPAPAAAEPANEAAEASAEPTAAPEIGTVDDWDRLAADGAPEPALPSEPDEAPDDALADFGADGLDPAPAPDGPSAPDDLPQPTPSNARRGHVWLEHAGWALSLVLLLAVAQGTVHVEPGAHEVPPGEIEVAGLVAENVRGRFVENARSGTLFVVSGELRNRGAAARAGGELRVVVLDEHGFSFEGRDAPVGLTLAEARVRETPIGALQQQQAGLARTLGERALAPGEGVSFQAIFGDLPDGAVRFRLEPAPGRAKGAARDARGPGLEEGMPEAGRG